MSWDTSAEDGLAVLRRSAAVLDRVSRKGLAAPPMNAAPSGTPDRTIALPTPPAVAPPRSPASIRVSRNGSILISPAAAAAVVATPRAVTAPSSSDVAVSRTILQLRRERDAALAKAGAAEAAEIEGVERWALAQAEARFERRAMQASHGEAIAAYDAAVAALKARVKSAEAQRDAAVSAGRPSHHAQVEDALRRSHSMALAKMADEVEAARRDARSSASYADLVCANVGGCIAELCSEVELRALRAELANVSAVAARRIATAERRATSAALELASASNATTAEIQAARIQSLAFEQSAALARESVERRRGIAAAAERDAALHAAALRRRETELETEKELALEEQARWLRAEFDARRAADLERQSAVIAQPMSCHMQQLATMEWADELAVEDVVLAVGGTTERVGHGGGLEWTGQSDVAAVARIAIPAIQNA